MKANHYINLAAMAALSFIAMYFLMYSMVDVFGNVFVNLNQAYMAGLMTAPMVIIELTLMRATYGNAQLNGVIVGAGVIALIAFFLLVREQVLISDTQFLRSMIPHHAAAILMCKKASIEDPEIKDLCTAIITSQQSEIDLMKAKLDALGK